ncbi:MAG: Pre-mRNA-splicing factor slt11 [Marteilia pararefringens]
MLERRAAANVSSFKSSGESDAQFPIVCETCLGANPYVRMTRQCLGSLCNVCQKPFTEFTWIPGRNARRKRCVLCQSCARLKHVCQVCILDLDYQVPVEVIFLKDFARADYGCRLETEF